MDDERHTHDPHDQDVASGGYPETNPEGADAEGVSRTRKDGAAGDRAPSTSTDEEADRTASTGNPGAAG